MFKRANTGRMSTGFCSTGRHGPLFAGFRELDGMFNYAFDFILVCRREPICESLQLRFRLRATRPAASVPCRLLTGFGNVISLTYWLQMKLLGQSAG
jgi:hypothetical protein